MIGIFYSVPVDVYCLGWIENPRTLLVTSSLLLKVDRNPKNVIGCVICKTISIQIATPSIRVLWDTQRLILIHSTTMGRLTHEQKAKIVRLRSKNKNISEIVRILADDECQTSRLSVRRFLRRFQERQSLENTPTPGRPAEQVTLEVLNFIDAEMEKNDELTAPHRRNKINEKFHCDFSESKVKRIRKKLGWVQTGTKYCQLIHEPNRVRRLEFAMKCLEDRESFSDVIFTDECSVHMENHAKLSFRRKWEPPKMKGRPKHPYKVHVWAGISKRGATKVLIFTGNMDAQFYTEHILKRTLLPFIREKFADGHRFQQDNDPKHTSRLAKEFMEREGINWWKTPPESPDLNPIELLWHELKHFLRTIVKPTTKDELVAGITRFWRERVTPGKCHIYINHLKKVVPLVVKREGRSSGH